MNAADLSARVADIALALSDSAGLDDVCDALERGQLERGSTGPVRSMIAGGNAAVEAPLRELLDMWAQEAPGLTGACLSFALRSAGAVASRLRATSPTTQVVWTGPKIDGSFLRATREVVREILRDATQELLVVGYWIAARDDGEGIIEEVIDSLADAVRRSVAVTIVLDERERVDGRNNRQILVEVWPTDVPLPRILTWRLPIHDYHLKLHAKVLVADNRDALVTSANLTSFAMDRNMEMGVRLLGSPAATIAQHFRLLDELKTLEPY